MTWSRRAHWLLWLACAGCGKSADDPEPASSAPVTAAGVRWVGRVDTTDPAAPRFAWSGSGFVATVSGTSIALSLETVGTSDPVFFQPLIDGVPGARFSQPAGALSVELATGLADGDHVVELYRETEGRYGENVFRGFSAGTLQDPPASSGRLIEIVGDSISAGFGNLGSEEHPNYGPDPSGGCTFTTETESAYNTYGAIAARRLGADASIVAVSGWGVYRDNGNSIGGAVPLVYQSALGPRTTPLWSFQQRADVVVINLGTNDFATGDPGETEFKTAFSSLLDTIRGKYPEAWIFCMIGPLLYDTGLTQATAYTTALVDERNAAGDSRIELLNFGQQDISLGTGCSYHPNVSVQTAMADRLVAAIQGALGW